MSSNPAWPDATPRILGVDPGSIVTGWGLVGGSPARPEWLESGVVRLGPSSEPLAQRLCRLKDGLAELTRRLRPTVAAVESPYHGTNARSALQLAQARGVVLAVLAGSGLEVAEYTPATVKSAVTGNGRAPKEQVRSMVARLLGHGAIEGPHDVTDALAVALCHAASRRHHALTAGTRR